MSQVLDSLFRKNIVTLKDYKANRIHVTIAKQE